MTDTKMKLHKMPASAERRARYSEATAHGAARVARQAFERGGAAWKYNTHLPANPSRRMLELSRKKFDLAMTLHLDVIDRIERVIAICEDGERSGADRLDEIHRLMVEDAR